MVKTFDISNLDYCIFKY